MNLIKRLLPIRLLWRMLDNPALFYAARLPLVGRQHQTKRLLRQHLKVVPGELVLDVCCGIGEFADVVDTQYLGLDLNPQFIECARRRYWGVRMKDFEVIDVNQLQYPSGHFDKAIMINGLHHFSDQEAIHLLTSIRHVTKSLVIIIDIDGTPKGLIRRTLVAMDRGRFMRNPSDLETLIARVFTIEEVMTFNVGLYTELLFRCPISATV